MRILIIIFLSLFVVSCGNDADTIQADKTRDLMAEAERQLGMPAIVNFQERRIAKMIFELRDQEDLTTYAYLVNLEGQLVFIGRCVGFGLPYSVQYTNPKRLLTGNNTFPQADPNGLFMPEGLSATWLLMVDEETGKAHPVYVEPQVMVSPFKLH